MFFTFLTLCMLPATPAMAASYDIINNNGRVMDPETNWEDGSMRSSISAARPSWSARSIDLGSSSLALRRHLQMIYDKTVNFEDRDTNSGSVDKLSRLILFLRRNDRHIVS